MVRVVAPRPSTDSGRGATTLTLPIIHIGKHVPMWYSVGTMNQELQKKLEAQAAKIEAIYVSVEKTRKYFVLIFWVTVVGFVLPLIGLAFAVPNFLNVYSNIGQGL